MPRKKKEEMKSVKIAASTHARLLILSNMLNVTISDVIDDAVKKTYPDIIEEVDRLMSRVAQRGLQSKNPQNDTK